MATFIYNDLSVARITPITSIKIIQPTNTWWFIGGLRTGSQFSITPITDIGDKGEDVIEAFVLEGTLEIFQNDYEDLGLDFIYKQLMAEKVTFIQIISSGMDSAGSAAGGVLDAGGDIANVTIRDSGVTFSFDHNAEMPILKIKFRSIFSIDVFDYSSAKKLYTQSFWS